MVKAQSARLDRKKLFGDPVMVSTIVVLLIFLALFILYPLAMLLIDSVVSEGRLTLDVFSRVLENAGVFKQDAAGQQAFVRFMYSVGFKAAD